MRRWTVVPVLLATCMLGLGAPDEEAARALAAGNTALGKRDYAGAKAAFESAVTGARERGDAPAVLEGTRRLAAVARLQGDFAGAEQLLSGAVAMAVTAHGDKSEQVAVVLSELGSAQRAQRKLTEAMLSLESCVQTRQAAGSKPADTVRDLALLARTYQETGDFERAIKRWREALDLWDSAMPQDSAEILGVVDALAGLHRDNSEYEAAEVLLRRSLATRESTYGPESAEMIPTLDSLAYTLFGQKKYTDAEPFYQRLLAIWKASAGPDHPMVALTLEKMTEFYAAQERYAEAEPLVSEALTIRTVAHLRNLNQKGRVMLMQAKLAEADQIYRQAIRIGDDASMPDEVMDPLLRTHAQLLRELKKPAEAAVLDKRVKAAIMKNTNLRPLPPKPARPK